MRTLAFIGFMSSLAACASEERVLVIDDELPDEVEFIVAAAVSPNETHATALLTRDGAAFVGRFEEVEDSAMLWVLGFTAEQIRQLSDEEPSLLANASFSRARTGEPQLPTPHWLARAPWSAGTVSLESPLAGERPPGLTAGWLPRCPRLVTDRTRVRVVGIDPCGATATQVGCQLEISLGICGLGVSGTLVSGAVSVLEGQGEFSRCESSPERPGSFECSLAGGGADRLELVEAEPPRFEVQPFEITSERLELNHTGGIPFRGGTLFGPALLGDRIAVSRMSLNRGCETSSPFSELVLVDPQSGDAVLTATVADCLVILESEPERDSFLGFSGLPGAARVYRFDRDGAILETRALAPTNGLRANLDTARVVGDRVMVVLRFQYEPAPELPAELIVLDRSTLEVVFRVPELARPPHAPFARGEDLALMGGSVARFFDRNTGEQVGLWSAAQTQSGCAPGFIPDANWDAAGARVLASEHRDLNRLLLIDRDRCLGIGFHEWLAVPLELLPTTDPNLWLVSLNGNERVSPGVHENTGIAVVDLAAMRFVPGALRFGYGPLQGLVEDEAGDIWGTLQWAGELVRIRKTR